MKRIIGYVALLSVLLVGTALGVTVTNTTRIFAAMLAGTLTVTNNLATTDRGFTVFSIGLSPAGTTATTSVLFSTPSSNFASNGVTPFHWVLTIQLNETAGTVAGNFVVTLVFNNGGNLINGGPSSQTITLFVSTGATATPGAGVFCLFDIGPSLLSPFSYALTVASM